MLGYYDYFAWDASYRKTASLRLKHIRKFIPASAKLLEIGTSTGSFLNEARQAGFEVEGLDISAVFASMAAQAYGLTIRTDFIEDAHLPQAYYDVICSFGGIACWRDPLKGLENVRQALKPGGVFVLNHPNVDGILGKMMGARYPEYNHASLTILSNKTMQAFLEKAGFQIVFSQNERQYASLERIVTYLKSDLGNNLVHALRLADVTIPVIAFGTTFSICRLAT
jgi:SAM-dependent methyltransferase